jgi:hypothetical protein
MRDGFDFYVEPQFDENEGEDFVAEDRPSPEEVRAFWDEVRPYEVEAPF